MKIQFLESSEHGLRWMKAYYRQNAQLNWKKFLEKFNRAQSVLCEQPYSGRLYEDFNDVRELQIANSTFSFLYTYKNDIIYIIDVRDQRGLRSAEALKKFNQNLRKKYKL